MDVPRTEMQSSSDSEIHPKSFGSTELSNINLTRTFIVNFKYMLEKGFGHPPTNHESSTSSVAVYFKYTRPVSNTLSIEELLSGLNRSSQWIMQIKGILE